MVKLEKKDLGYKVLSISMYDKDVADMDRLVETAKKVGITRANRSLIIRIALKQLDLEKVNWGPLKNED